VDTLSAGRISTLQPTDFGSTLFESEMKLNFAARYFQCNLMPNGLEKMFERLGVTDTNYLLYHQSAKRSSDADDLRSQYIQRSGAAALHGYGLASSTVSQNLGKVPVFAAGGIEHTSIGLLAGMLGASAVIGGINAYGSAETQTVKNVNKSNDSERKKAAAQAVAGTEAQAGTGQSRMDRMKENFQRMNQAAYSFGGFMKGHFDSNRACADLKAALESNLEVESALKAMIDAVDLAKSQANELPPLTQIQTVSSEGSDGSDGHQANVQPEGSHPQ